jgi:hypothetical protein
MFSLQYTIYGSCTGSKKTESNTSAFIDLQSMEIKKSIKTSILGAESGKSGRECFKIIHYHDSMMNYER